MSNVAEAVKVVAVIAVVISFEIAVETVVDSIGVAVTDIVDVADAAAADALPVYVITYVGGIVQSFHIYRVLLGPVRPSAT